MSKNLAATKLKNDLLNAIQSTVADAIAPRLSNSLELYRKGMITADEVLDEILKAASVASEVK